MAIYIHCYLPPFPTLPPLQPLIWSPFLYLLFQECYIYHEIKRHLPHGRRVMTNLDSILKRTDITLPTKVHMVKAMIFPVVIYGSGSLTT